MIIINTNSSSLLKILVSKNQPNIIIKPNNSKVLLSKFSKKTKEQVQSTSKTTKTISANCSKI